MGLVTPGSKTLTSVDLGSLKPEDGAEKTAYEDHTTCIKFTSSENLRSL